MTPSRRRILAVRKLRAAWEAMQREGIVLTHRRKLLDAVSALHDESAEHSDTVHAARQSYHHTGEYLREIRGQLRQCWEDAQRLGAGVSILRRYAVAAGYHEYERDNPPFRRSFRVDSTNGTFVKIPETCPDCHRSYLECDCGDVI